MKNCKIDFESTDKYETMAIGSAVDPDDEPSIAIAIHEEATFNEVYEGIAFMIELLQGMANNELREEAAKLNKRPVFGNDKQIKQMAIVEEARICFAKIQGAANLLGCCL